MRGHVNLRCGLAALAWTVAASLAAAAPAQSAESEPVLSAVPAMAAAATTINPSQPIQVEMNEGQLIRLNSAASNIFIANPKIADVTVKSAKLIYIFGKRTGQTTLYALDRNDRVLASLRVQVTHNLSGLNSALDTMITTGKVRGNSIKGAIVLTGRVTDPADAENARRVAQRFINGKREEVINQIQVTAANQVMLQVRIAEVARTAIKLFGFNWEAGGTTSNLQIAGATGAFDTPGSFPVLRDPATDVIVGLSTIGNSIFVNGLIDALETDNLVTVLAEPTLTALSGETASFLAGGEFPFPVLTDDGIIIEFKDFGVSLSFAPTVLSGNRISMRVRPEVSELSSQGGIAIAGFSVPGINTRRAETTVELASGQSLVIAGLFSNSSEEELRKFPVLSSIPIIGQLFDSDRFETRETELLIIVTPYLVGPTNERIPLPTDNFVRNQETTTVRANLGQAPGPKVIPLATSTPLAQNLGGQAGFIVE